MREQRKERLDGTARARAKNQDQDQAGWRRWAGKVREKKKGGTIQSRRNVLPRVPKEIEIGGGQTVRGWMDGWIVERADRMRI